jgi:hypothetical protein
LLLLLLLLLVLLVFKGKMSVQSPDADTHTYSIVVTTAGESTHFENAVDNDGAILSTTQFISSMFTPFDEHAAATGIVNGRNFRQYRVRV